MGSPVGAHLLVVLFVGTAVDGAPVLGAGAPLLELAGVAGLRLGPVARSSIAAGPRMAVQLVLGGTNVEVLLGIVAEVAGTEEAGVAEVEVGDGHVRPDARLLQGSDVPAGAVPGVTGDVAGSDAPPEGAPPQEVEHGAVLGYLRGGNQGVEDHPGLTPIYDVVGLVTELAARFGPSHSTCVGVRLRRPRVGGAWPVAALEGAVLRSVPRNPVPLSRVALPEGGVLARW